MPAFTENQIGTFRIDRMLRPHNEDLYKSVQKYIAEKWPNQKEILSLAYWQIKDEHITAGDLFFLVVQTLYGIGYEDVVVPAICRQIFEYWDEDLLRETERSNAEHDNPHRLWNRDCDCFVNGVEEEDCNHPPGRVKGLEELFAMDSKRIEVKANE